MSPSTACCKPREYLNLQILVISSKRAEALSDKLCLAYFGNHIPGSLTSSRITFSNRVNTFFDDNDICLFVLVKEFRVMLKIGFVFF